MATPKLRWPNNAESSRIQSKELAEDTEQLLQQALDDLRNNPDRCELYLVYAMRHLKHIQLLLTEAKVGR
jgi:hypothetical protein